MADLTFQVPDDKMAELVDAWSTGYLAEVPDPSSRGDMIPNPQSKEDFAKEQIKKMIADRIRVHISTQGPEFPIT